MRATRKFLLLVVLPLLLLGAGLESLGRLLDPDPDPDTPAGRTLRFKETFYVDDPELITRLRPSVRSTFAWLREDADVPVRINSRGFRGPEFDPPAPDALRVLVLGDSVSFGLYLRYEDAWPTLLRETLAARAGGRPVQVRNLAVPGYSTFQGRILFERHALQSDFQPHVVVFAFGFNDGYPRPQDDRTTRAAYRAALTTTPGRLRRWLERSRFLRWLLRPPPRPATTLRVPPDQLEENLEAVARGARKAGIELLLVNSCLPFKYPRATMRAVAARHGVVYVDFRTVFEEHEGLPHPRPWPARTRTRLRVHLGGLRIPPAPDSRPALYALLVENPTRRLRYRRIALSDDGEGADERRGDGVWSCWIEAPPQSSPEVAFGAPGLADRIPQFRTDEAVLAGFHFADVTPAPACDVRRPLATPWDRLVAAPDPIHPSALGSRVMAKAVARAVLSTRAWRAFAGR